LKKKVNSKKNQEEINQSIIPVQSSSQYIAPLPSSLQPHQLSTNISIQVPTSQVATLPVVVTTLAKEVIPPKPLEENKSWTKFAQFSRELGKQPNMAPPIPTFLFSYAPAPLR